MFGGEEEDDFTPNPSSKLASLFGFGKASSDEGNASLTYTAPKQPKKGRPESQTSKGSEVTPPTSSSGPPKLSIILVKAVHTYKLAEGNYNAQGKLGAAVLGNTTTKMYQLLLYKGKQQHVTSCRITGQFQFVIQPNNYATFYDDQTQNWSVMFETSEDAIEFAKEIGLARANAVKDPSEQQLMVQDLLFGVGSGANEGDMVEIRYIVYPMSEGRLGQQIENTTLAEKPLRVMLNRGSWEEGILGAAKGCKRMIMLPPHLAGPWKAKVPPDSGVMVEVDVGRFKSNRAADSGDSTDDTSIKARGASISEALTNSPKTHKASIISRMARMGQATLPLKGAIPCNPSDSEETEEETNIVNKAPSKSRAPKNRPVAEKPVQNTMLPPPQQVALYQPLWQQGPPPPQQPSPFVRTNGSMAYMQPQYPMQTVSSPQMYQVSTPPSMPSPESHMSVLLAESRTQNAELRMGVAKVADKVDQVMIKLDTMYQRRESLASGMDPSAVLGSIQKLVTENETLRTEVEEKRAKIDQLYGMLHSNVMEGRNDSQLLRLQQEKAQLTGDLDEARSRHNSLELLLLNKGEELLHYKKLVKEKNQRLSTYEEEINNYEVEVADLKKALTEEKKQHECHTSEHLKDVKCLKQENSDLEEQIKHLKEELRKTEVDTSRHSEHVKNLEQENSALMDRIHNLETQKASSSSDIVDEVKRVMNIVYHQTASRFSPGVSYSSTEVKQMLMNTIREFTLKYLEGQKGSTEEKPSLELASSKVSAQEVNEESKPSLKTEVPVKRDSEEKQVPGSSSDDVKMKLATVPIKQEDKLSLQSHEPEEVDVEIIEATPSESKAEIHHSDHSEEEKPPSETISSEQMPLSGPGRPAHTEAHNVPEAETKAATPKAEMEDDKSSNTSQASKEKQSRESSPERSWRPQPPPPPLFDDDDDDDDWLS